VSKINFRKRREYTIEGEDLLFTTKTEVENGVLKIYIEKDKSISTTKAHL
jgi:hypothetical protein